MWANQTAVVQPRLIPSQLPCGLKHSSSSSAMPIVSLWANKIGISSTRSVATVSCSVMPTAYRIFKILSPFDRTESHKGENLEKPFTPFINSSIVNASEPAPEGDARQHGAILQPFTNPSPTQPLESGGYLPVCYVQVVEEEDGMKPHPSYIDQLVDTPGGLGYLTGNWREQAVTFTAPEHKKWLRYTFGVRLLQDDVERFYLP